MATEDARRFWREMELITALPLANPSALYFWLPAKPNPSNYIREDMELRQMLGRAEKHMPRKMAAEIAREATEFADSCLLAAALPRMISHHEFLLGGHGPAEQAKPGKWAGAPALAIQAASSMLAAMLLRNFD